MRGGYLYIATATALNNSRAGQVRGLSEKTRPPNWRKLPHRAVWYRRPFAPGFPPPPRPPVLVENARWSGSVYAWLRKRQVA